MLCNGLQGRRRILEYYGFQWLESQLITSLVGCFSKAVSDNSEQVPGIQGDVVGRKADLRKNRKRWIIDRALSNTMRLLLIMENGIMPRNRELQAGVACIGDAGHRRIYMRG